jgi:hypothetical protein
VMNTHESRVSTVEGLEQETSPNSIETIRAARERIGDGVDEVEFMRSLRARPRRTNSEGARRGQGKAILQPHLDLEAVRDRASHTDRLAVAIWLSVGVLVTLCFLAAHLISSYLGRAPTV